MWVTLLKAAISATVIVAVADLADRVPLALANYTGWSFWPSFAAGLLYRSLANS